MVKSVKQFIQFIENHNLSIYILISVFVYLDIIDTEINIITAYMTFLVYMNNGKLARVNIKHKYKIIVSMLTLHYSSEKLSKVNNNNIEYK